METKVERFFDWLLKRRVYVLGVFALILAGSFLAGYIYQNKLTKEREGSVLFDDTWQRAYAILNDLQAQPNQQYTVNSPNFAQVTNLYQQVLLDLETLTIDYVDTVAGAKAAVLVQAILPLTNLNALMADQTVITSLSSEGYLDSIKNNHPNFWGSLIAITEAVEAERNLDFATALNSYQEALTLDKKNYLGDYITIAIAKNNEVLGNTNEAIIYYQQLEDEYPDSVWLSFAMGKKYILSNQSAANANIVVPTTDTNG